MLRYPFIVLLLIGGFSFTSSGLQDPQDEDKQKDDDTIVLPRSGPDAIARSDFMRTKLMHSQNIFEGLTTGNFKLIKEGIAEVKMVTEAAEWIKIDNENYQKLEEDFKTSIQRLSEAAKSGNLEATALRYYQMSTSCIDCHKHIRIVKYDF